MTLMGCPAVLSAWYVGFMHIFGLAKYYEIIMSLSWAFELPHFRRGMRHNGSVFVLTFIQRSDTASVPSLLESLEKLNPQVTFAQTYPDEAQGAFESASDALHAALLAAHAHGFWVGIGAGELTFPRFAGALGALNITDCTGDALEFSRLAVEYARGGAPSRGIAVMARDRSLTEMATGSARLLYRVCADRTEAEWRVVRLLVPGVRGQQKAAAAALGITTQAVSRALVRSLWHEEQAARATVVNLMDRMDVAEPSVIAAE